MIGTSFTNSLPKFPPKAIHFAKEAISRLFLSFAKSCKTNEAIVIWEVSSLSATSLTHSKTDSNLVRCCLMVSDRSLLRKCLDLETVEQVALSRLVIFFFGHGCQGISWFHHSSSIEIQSVCEISSD